MNFVQLFPQDKIKVHVAENSHIYIYALFKNCSLLENPVSQAGFISMGYVKNREVKLGDDVSILRRFMYSFNI